MASSGLLIQAASGLERFMVGSQQNKSLKDSIVAQVSATVYYQSHVMSNLMSNKRIQSNFQRIIFNQIQQDFYNFVDAMARVKTKQYHHVYEWNRSGDPAARLFKLNMMPTNDFAVRMSYEMLLSKSPVPNKKGKRRHIFARKASVMENGETVVISPRYSNRLVFDTPSYTVFMPKGKSVTVTKPGGIAVRGSLQNAYKMFFTGNMVNESIKRSGFQNIFTSAAVKSLRIPNGIKKVKYSFSPNTVRVMAENSVNSVGVI